MQREQYSHLSLLAIMAVANAGPQAYLLEIGELLRIATGHPVQNDTLRQMLHRLCGYGMLAHAPEGRRRLVVRAGSPRTKFRVTPAGHKLVKQHLRGWNSLVKGLGPRFR